MPPPISHSSMNQKSQNRKRKCAISNDSDDMSIPDLNSTDTDSSSLIPNSQGSCMGISVINMVKGKSRKRKTRQQLDESESK